MRTNKYILLAATLLGLSSCGNKRGDYDASGTFEATEVIGDNQIGVPLPEYLREGHCGRGGRGL